MRVLFSLCKLFLFYLFFTLPLQGSATALPVESCTTVLPVDDEEFAAFMEMPAHEFKERMIDIFLLQDPLVRKLLVKFNKPDQQFILIQLLTLGNELSSFTPEQKILDIKSLNVRGYLGHLPLQLGSLASLAVLELKKNETHLKLDVTDLEDQLVLQTLRALYKALDKREDVKSALAIYLSGSVNRKVFKNVIRFFESYHNYCHVHKKQKPDGTFTPAPLEPWQMSTFKASLTIGSLTAMSYFGLKALTGFSGPEMGLVEMAAISGWYCYHQWCKRHADYFDHRHLIHKIAGITQSQPSLIARFQKSLDEKLLPRNEATTRNQIRNSRRSEALLHQEWLHIRADLQLNSKENRHLFFAGLLQAINWFQGEQLALHSDQAVQIALENMRSLIKSGLRSKEPKQRQILYQFSQLYAEFAGLMSQRMDGLTNLQEHLADIGSALDSHLEFVKSLEDNSASSLSTESLQDLYNQSIFWSQLGERLIQMQDALQFEKESLSAVHDALRDFIPAIMTLHAVGDQGEDNNAALILKGIWKIVGDPT